MEARNQKRWRHFEKGEKPPEDWADEAYARIEAEDRKRAWD